MSEMQRQGQGVIEMRGRSGMRHLPKKSTRMIPIPCRCENGHEFDSVDAQLNEMKCPECQTEKWEIVGKVI